MLNEYTQGNKGLKNTETHNKSFSQPNILIIACVLEMSVLNIWISKYPLSVNVWYLKQFILNGWMC